MSSEKKKMSNAKLAALIVSVALHGAIAYYLGSMALDYALPKGEVTSIEMNIDMPQGESTEVDVVKETPAPPAPPEPAPAPEKPAPVKPVVEKKAPAPKAPKIIPESLPTKEAVVEDQQGEMPVATEVPDEPVPQVEPPQPEQTETPIQEAAVEPTPEAAPIPQAEPTPAPVEANQAAGTGTAATTEPAPAGPTATEQGYGTPVGDQSENLIPYGSNKGHKYPKMGRMRKLEGAATVQYTVSPTGEVIEAKLMQSSGHSSLDSEAVDVIKKWKFKPLKNEVTYEKEVIFKLTGEAQAAPSKLRRLEK